jgi:hypothetical protein
MGLNELLEEDDCCLLADGSLFLYSVNCSFSTDIYRNRPNANPATRHTTTPSTKRISQPLFHPIDPASSLSDPTGPSDVAPATRSSLPCHPTLTRHGRSLTCVRRAGARRETRPDSLRGELNRRSTITTRGATIEVWNWFFDAAWWSSPHY